MDFVATLQWNFVCSSWRGGLSFPIPADILQSNGCIFYTLTTAVSYRQNYIYLRDYTKCDSWWSQSTFNSWAKKKLIDHTTTTIYHCNFSKCKQQVHRVSYVCGNNFIILNVSLIPLSCFSLANFRLNRTAVPTYKYVLSRLSRQ